VVSAQQAAGISGNNTPVAPPDASPDVRVAVRIHSTPPRCGYIPGVGYGAVGLGSCASATAGGGAGLRASGARRPLVLVGPLCPGRRGVLAGRVEVGEMRRDCT
jgi:hypothetical protein